MILGPAGCCGGEIQGLDRLVEAVMLGGAAILVLSVAVIALSRVLQGWRR